MKERMRHVNELVSALRDIKYKENEIKGELISVIDDLPEVKAALECGLVRCNFPIPAGFNRSIRKDRIRR